MPDPALSAAIMEAYASAPVTDVAWHTLELWHPAWAAPIRVVRDSQNLIARIEAGAARDAGALVTFVGYAFDLVPPDQTTTALPQATLEIDNVSREIGAQLAVAAVQNDPVTMIYRIYLQSDLEIGPENIPPTELQVTSATGTPMRVRATAGYPNLLDRRFPALDYVLDSFPGLLR